MSSMEAPDVERVFRNRNWVRGAGGHLYFNGNGGSTHPHLHLILNGVGCVPSGGDARAAVRMLAFSDGAQGQGGGGVTYVGTADATLRKPQARVNFLDFPDAKVWFWTNHELAIASINNHNVRDEFDWIISYFGDRSINGGHSGVG